MASALDVNARYTQVASAMMRVLFMYPNCGDIRPDGRIIGEKPVEGSTSLTGSFPDSSEPPKVTIP
jgi:hypothetical protein